MGQFQMESMMQRLGGVVVSRLDFQSQIFYQKITSSEVLPFKPQ